MSESLTTRAQREIRDLAAELGNDVQECFSCATSDHCNQSLLDTRLHGAIFSAYHAGMVMGRLLLEKESKK